MEDSSLQDQDKCRPTKHTTAEVLKVWSAPPPRKINIYSYFGGHFACLKKSFERSYIIQLAKKFPHMVGR
jgi:hypothetical protein